MLCYLWCTLLSSRLWMA